MQSALGNSEAVLERQASHQQAGPRLVMRDGVHLFDPTNSHHKVLAQHGAATTAAGHHMPSTHHSPDPTKSNPTHSAEERPMQRSACCSTLLVPVMSSKDSCIVALPASKSLFVEVCLLCSAAPVLYILLSPSAQVADAYLQEPPWWMWCLCMASGAVLLPPGGVKAYKTCSQGTTLGIWTIHTVGLPPGFRKMCLKPVYCPWSMLRLLQDGRSGCFVTSCSHTETSLPLAGPMFSIAHCSIWIDCHRPGSMFRHVLTLLAGIEANAADRVQVCSRC